MSMNTVQTTPSEFSAEDALRSYRAAAAVLSSFRSAALRPLELRYQDNGGTMLDLLEECERVVLDDGELRWMLKNSVRRQTLRELGTPAAIRRALEANTPRPDDALQRMFEACIAGSAPHLADQTLEELTATLQVRDWLEGTLPGLPPRAELIDRLEWSHLLEPFRRLVGPYFQGRQRELQDLHDYVFAARATRTIYQARPLMVYGAGGIGKSTLLAKFILDSVEKHSGKDFAFGYWDFDSTTLLPEEPVTLLAELALQIGLQFPAIKESLAVLRRHWLDDLADRARRQGRTDRSARSTAGYRDVAQRTIAESSYALASCLREFKRQVTELPGARQLRLLLVLDTFERAQEVGIDFLGALWEFLNELQAIFPLQRVIIAGRVPLDEQLAQNRLTYTPYPLPELDAQAATGYLAERGITKPALAQAIFARVGGDPLSLRLVVDSLQQEQEEAGGNLAQLTALPPDFAELTVDHELNQGWLYRRYLARVPADIRPLAHPGLVLRRITPDLIRHVLAGPCKVAVPDDDAAREMFQLLAKQVFLVKQEANNRWALTHRSDVRKRMLRGLVQTAGSAVYEIHRAAIDYYASLPGQPDPVTRAEEIYHRLFLTRDRSELDARWMTGVAPYLRDAVDEIPVEMRGYLISKAELTTVAFVWDEADARSREDHVATRARDAINARQPEIALQLLSEIRERLPGSELFRLEAQALVKLGRFPEARIAANEGIFSARKAGTADLQLDLLLIAVEADTQLGQYGRARELLAEAGALPVERSGPGAELLKLELLMRRLRLCRLSPAECSEDLLDLRGQAVARLESSTFFDLAVREDTSLLLDAVEEVGVDRPGLLSRAAAALPHAFSTPTSEQQMAVLLRQWSETMGSRRSEDAAALMALAQQLESGQPLKAVAAGLRQPDTWPAMIDQLVTTRAPTQAFVSGLVGLLRAATAGSAPASSGTVAVERQIWRVLLDAFSRDELARFLRIEFDLEIDAIAGQSSYADTAFQVAQYFERQGRTEELIGRLLDARPSNPLVRQLQQQLQAATAEPPATLEAAPQPAVQIAGDFYNSQINVTGSAVVAGNLYNTTVYVASRSVPRTLLDTLPKALPIQGTSGEPSPIAPEFVFSWALAMRQAMHAVCRIETKEGLCTGFLVGPSLLLIPGLMVEPIRRARADNVTVLARFDLHHAPDGVLQSGTAYPLAADWLVATANPAEQSGSPAAGSGCALVRLQGEPGTEHVPGEDIPRGWLALSPAPPAPGAGLFMLHHGSGGPLQLDYADIEAAAGGSTPEAVLRARRAEISPGASGAPCCNEQWQVVAVRLGRQPETQNLMAVWSRELLADAPFAAAIQEQLQAGAGASDPTARLAALQQTLVDHFTFEELQALGAELGVDAAQLAHSTRTENAQALLDAVGEQNKLDLLVRRGAELRPQAKWQ